MADSGRLLKQPLLVPDGDHASARRSKKLPLALGRLRRCRTAPRSVAGAHQEFPRPRCKNSDGIAPVAPRELLAGAGTRPSFGLVGVLLLAYLAAGTTAFSLAMDHMSGRRTASAALDALYFSVLTMTTVGYGDLVPASDGAKLLACAFAFAGVALVGAFLGRTADYLVEKQHALLLSALTRRRDVEATSSRARHKLYITAALLAVVLVSGTAFLVAVEGMRPVDAFYCACATVTTVGYGDRSFTSAAGRAFAAAWITVGTLVVALLVLYATEVGAERRQRALARWVLTRRTTCTDLEAADLDGDRSVSAAEFALYKIKELGKVSQEEIAEILDEFHDLDADDSGTLTPRDLVVTQLG